MKLKMSTFSAALSLALAFLLISPSVFAQTPEKMSYQAVIRNTSNQLVTNDVVGMKISILYGSPTGTLVYSETKTPTTNSNGLVSLEIGGDYTGFDTIHWANGNYFIKTETDPEGGTDYTIIGTSQLLSVPYALHSKTAESITGGITETDPVFGASIAKGITGTDTANWNNNMLPAGFYMETIYNNGMSWVSTNSIQTDGFMALINDLNVNMPLIANNGINSWGVYKSHLATGFSPLDILSTTKVNNLNVDMLDDFHAGNTSGNISVSNGILDTNLNADLLDSKHAADFATSSHVHSNLTQSTGIATFTYNGSSATTIGLTGQALLLHLFSENGLMARKADGTFTSRTIQCSGNGISVTNGDGIFSNPVISLNIGSASTQVAAGDHTHTGLYRPIGWVPAWTDVTGKPTGSNPGDMLYWNGSAWLNVPAGQAGQFLQFTASNIPTWTSFTPVLTTNTVTSITSTTATCGGNVTSEGAMPVTARGVCWSTSPNPTTADPKTTDGTGSGTFTSSISGLTLGNTYYVRAYATNSLGTVYGNQVTFMAIAIGDNYQGGIVAYIIQSGDPGYIAGETHGLITTAADQGQIQWWNGSYITTGAAATALGTGNANTNTIVAAQGAGSYAAKLCADLTIGPYSDWYLPSKDELHKIFLNKGASGITITLAHWSSSEYSNTIAWAENMDNGLQAYWITKDNSYFVRAVRSF